MSIINCHGTYTCGSIVCGTRLASTGSVVGLTEPQIMAIATALSSVGIEAEAGGSAISKLLKEIEVAAKSYGTANDVISQTGLSLRELELLADADSTTFKGLAQNLGLTSDELQSYMESAKALESFADVVQLTINNEQCTIMVSPYGDEFKNSSALADT